MKGNLIISAGFISPEADTGSTPVTATMTFHLESYSFTMKYTAYVLYSATYNKHFPGNLSHLAQRLESHNVLGKEWTSRYRPWKLIYSKELDEQSATMQYEAWLKTGVGRDFIRKLDL